VTPILVRPPLVHVGADTAVPVARADLTIDERAAMFALLDAHFDGVRPDVFDRDLEEKDWVLRIVREGALVGFSTLQVYPTTFAGHHLNVIYSGDTVVAPEAWGTPVLARGWIALVRAIQAIRPDEPWYWLLLSSGFRTYRFLPVFWREFWPRHGAQLDDARREMTSALARERFNDCYDEQAGIVRFPLPQRLRPHLARIPEGRDLDPHVQFFLERNPGHSDGDELVCLTALSDDNLTAAGVRVVRGSSR
jgi:hypothetical protein